VAVIPNPEIEPPPGPITRLVAAVSAGGGPAAEADWLLRTAAIVTMLRIVATVIRALDLILTPFRALNWEWP
jgi:hypothetical protein